MSHHNDNAVSAAIASPAAVEKSSAAAEPCYGPPGQPDQAPDSSVYDELADRAWPRWLRALGATPWLEDGVLRGRPVDLPASALLTRQAATLALALLCEHQPARQDRPYLRQCVRASLIHWQLSLRGDGRPARKPLRKSPLHGAIVGYITRLLCETSGFQNPMLLGDIERQLRWLARRPGTMPWLEASTIAAFVDGAVLARDAKLLAIARSRLGDLLLLQDEDGWFPERGGPHTGLLTITIDGLAHAYRETGWSELEEPLK